MKDLIIVLTAVAVFVLPVWARSAEPTKASQSSYEKDIRKATTSESLTKADLAWHAMNTFGWDCEEVVSKEELTKDGYFIITCSSGKKLRVYPRQGQHPRITNIDGTYK